jgi:protein-L-isoaspartate(D-aspartate) O-methyltransferase
VNDRNGAAFDQARDRMRQLLLREGVEPAVVDAMASVPREEFVPAELRRHAYDDRALPIGEGQTISQPLMVALMVQAAQLRPSDRVLEVGTGSGYGAAVLSRLAREVISVERQRALIPRARDALARAGVDNVRVVEAGDVLGLPDEAPFDAIVVTAGAPHVPRTLLDQIDEGGRLVIPVGPLRMQELVRATKTPHGVTLTRLGPCGFVPLVGKEAWPDLEGNEASIRINVQ